MIGFLRGPVLSSHDYVSTIGIHSENGTIGYEVHINESPSVGRVLSLWIHEHAPQDAPHELYGFSTIAERDLFRRLLDIKGVGPKVAMRIVAATPMFQKVGGWVASDFTKIRGVGGTLAQRIVEAMQ